MKLVFLGREFDSPTAFAGEFLAYGSYANLVRAGADTPHKVELELHRRRQTSKRPKLVGIVRKKRGAR